MAEREQWATRTGFILAAAGSAIGLGDVWRFPYVAYTNGGGAFFVPYLFAFLTAGIPFLILEYVIGHRYRGSGPLSLFRITRKAEWIGWWQVAICFVIGCYYSVIIAWALSYTLFSLGLSWGGDPNAYFFGTYLNAPGQPGAMGGLVLSVLVPLVIVWAVTLFTLAKGVQGGIERASRIMMPVFFGLFILLVVRAVTLPGAARGLNALFKPDWGAISDTSVWIAAYAQIFFSLSVGFSIMITYASYLKRKMDLTNTALIVGFSNSSIELLAGIGVFAALGFMAQTSGQAVDRVVEDGIGLVFVAFPQLINELPALNQLFAVFFFGSLVLAGFTSQISLVEAYVAPVRDKFEVRRRRAVLIGGGLGALLSLVFATRGGIYVLDAADHFINNFGVVTAAILEIAVMAWLVRNLDELRAHANEVSDVHLGAWWKVALTVVTPVVLTIVLVDALRTDLAKNYEGYPTDFLLTYGWTVAAATLVVGVVAAMRSWSERSLEPAPRR